MAELILENPDVRSGYNQSAGAAPAERELDSRHERATSTTGLPQAGFNSYNAAGAAAVRERASSMTSVGERPSLAGSVPMMTATGSSSSATASYGTLPPGGEAAGARGGRGRAGRWSIPNGEYYQRVKGFFQGMRD